MGLLSSIFGRKAKRKAARLEKARAKAMEQDAMRQQEAATEDYQIQEQELEADLARRGLSQSSIADENRSSFRRARERAFQGLDTGVSLARKGRKLANMQYRTNKLLDPLDFLDDTAGRVADWAGFGGGSDVPMDSPLRMKQGSRGRPLGGK